jgi:hypothetical protein
MDANVYLLFYHRINWILVEFWNDIVIINEFIFFVIILFCTQDDLNQECVKSL